MKQLQQLILGLAIGLVILWGGGPVLAAGPTVSTTAAVTTDKTATWSWTGTTSSYRYSLDNETDWQATTETSFSPSGPLSRGTHILYVQEDQSGSWSESSSASLYCLETESDATVLISDGVDLTAFSDFVNAVPANGVVNAKLTADIALSNTETNPWKPIGKNNSYRYQGVFDGQNHIIRGLYLSFGNDFSGLFGMSTGTIKNLTLTDSTISGGYDVGAIIGLANSGSQIINCHNTATVSGTQRVGGIAGTFMGNLENCSNSGAVTGVKGSIGGIVGFQQGIMLNCFNTGTVKSTSSDVNDYIEIGGISGDSFFGSTSDCYNSGAIIFASFGTKCKQGSIIGQKSSSVTVLNCYYLKNTASNGIGSNSTDIDTETARKDTTSFTNGEVCYDLQAGQSSLCWGQTLTGSADPRPVLSTQSDKKVYRIIFDYSDATADLISYHNQNDSVSTLQSVDYALTLDGAPFTDSSYQVGSNDVAFTAIKREAFSGVSVTPYNESFDGSNHSLVTVSGAPEGAAITYSSTGQEGSFSDTLPEMNEVDSVDVYVKISDFYHYDFLCGKLTAIVTKASAPTVAPVEKNYTYGITNLDESIDVTTLLPANRGTSNYVLGTLSDNQGILDGTPSIGVNGCLNYRIKGGAVGDTATIPVIIDSNNYDPITVSVKINLIDKQTLIIDGISVSNKTYDGNPLLPAGSVTISDAGGQAVDPGPLTYRYHSTDGDSYDSSIAPIKAGSFQLDIFVPTENPTYTGNLGPISFNILPRPIEVKAQNQTITVGSERPADAYSPPDLAEGDTLTGVSFACDYLKNDIAKGIAGNYPITPSGGVVSGGNENYLITYKPGVLTVNPASTGGGTGGVVSPTLPEVSLSTHPLSFDAEGHLAIDIAGLPPGATVYYSGDGLSYATIPPVMTGAGSYPLYIKITCPGYTDYQTQAQVTVTKAVTTPPADITIIQPDDQSGGVVLLAEGLPSNRGATQFEIIGVSDPDQLLGNTPEVDQNGQLSYWLRQDVAAVRYDVSEMANNQMTTGATISIKVSMANYEDLTLKVMIGKELEEAIGIRYLTHIQDIGWETDWVTEGGLSGTSGQSKRLEALKVELIGDVPEGASIETAAHVQNQGDLGPFTMGTAAGTSGQGLRLENICLTLEDLSGYTLLYTVHVQNQGWLRDENDSSSWFKSGEIAGTAGQGLRLEGIKIMLVKTEETG